MRKFWFRRGLRFLGFALVFVGLMGFVVMALWNALLPTILGVATISFWQALGLLVLSRILFGGFGPRGFGGRGFRNGNERNDAEWGGGFGASRHEWKQKMAERWEQMTPEQRDQMKKQWRDRCRSWGRGRWGSQKNDDPDKGESKPTAF
ncbi:hypothetical protein [Spirosoma agri]|uniref:hypothetical protein n=1 Tax=Spirosoma agri TaxID=1987381 RepID=UPI001BB05E55|nr:hypothetical protein [Spirosoma agri]